MKMLGESLGRSKKLDYVLRDIHRFDGADPQPFHTRLVQNSPQQVFELYARREVAPVSTKVDPAQNDFAIAGIAELLKLLNYGIRRQAAASAAHKWNYAERAAGVASVLYLQRRASLIPFSAQHRIREQRLLLKNVADKDFR